jgi:hypothetical protein
MFQPFGFGTFVKAANPLRLLTSSRKQSTDGFLSFFFKFLNGSSLKSSSGFLVPSSLVSSRPMHIANKTAQRFDCWTRTRSALEGSLSMSTTTKLLVELVDADMLFVELVDADMIATIVDY